MKKTGEWGQFFPPELCVFFYNETLAQEQFPMNRDVAMANGWKWCDALPLPRGRGTINMQTLADNIQDVPDTICSEVLTCEESGMNYKITKSEFAFYKRMGIPIPRLHPTLRHLRRLQSRLPRHLNPRQCMCEKPDHDHTSRCPVEFETTYAPERPEIVYCEACYQEEVL